MLGLIPSKDQIKTVAKQGTQKYNSLEGNTKTATNIGLLVAGGLSLFAGYKVIKNIGGMFDTITGKKWNEERKQKEAVERTAIKSVLDSSRGKPTLSAMEAKNIANTMYQAFLNTQPEWSQNLWDEGTDEDMFYDALGLLKNREDWLLVSLQYGMPRKRNLAGEITYELNPKETRKARAILAKINVKI